MQDILTHLNTLIRPRLLIRAARIGADDYQRTTHLRPYFGQGHLPRNVPALIKLMEIEETLNHQRKTNAAGYSVARHVDLLIAMMGEARRLRHARTESVT